MTIVPFAGEQQYRDHLKTRMADARAFLDTLPILKVLVDDFRAFENEPRIDNVAAPAVEYFLTTVPAANLRYLINPRQTS